jgi:hypothetical protein
MSKKTPTSRIVIGITAIIIGLILILWGIVPFWGFQSGQNALIPILVFGGTGLLLIVLGTICMGSPKGKKSGRHTPPNPQPPDEPGEEEE